MWIENSWGRRKQIAFCLSVSIQLIFANHHIFYTLGLKAIASGHIGAIVLAGGQASRLGSDRPKGVLSLGTGLGSSTTDSLLFIQAAQIAHLQRIARERFPEEAEKSGGQITWLVMTSQTTDKETRAHLETVLLETGLQQCQVIVRTWTRKF